MVRWKPSGGLSQNLQPALEAGISVASIEYRFVDEAEGIEPVKAPLTDAARALSLFVVKHQHGM